MADMADMADMASKAPMGLAVDESLNATNSLQRRQQVESGPHPSNQGTLSTGAIVGLALGGTTAVVLFLVLVIFCANHA